MRFYSDVLGFESVFETDNDTADGPLLGFDRDVVSLRAHHVMTTGPSEGTPTELNLVEFVDPGIRPSAPPVMNDAGLTRLALLVDDLDEAFRRVSAYAGVDIVCPPRHIAIRQAETVLSTRWFSFRDPFGVFITMTE